jgi:hypothetical protein
MTMLLRLFRRCTARRCTVAPLALALTLPLTASAACLTASVGGTWQTGGFTAQSGTFTVSFDATSTASPTNSVIGLSNGTQTAYTGYACAVRFNPSGDIDARNGGAYAAASTIPYSANGTYHFRIVANVTAHTYSAYVTPPGGSELTIGSNYAFRTEQNTVASLNAFGVYVDPAGSGSDTLCNFALALPAASAPTFSPGSGTYSSAQSVTISSSTSGATIHYTTDGSTPTSTTGTIYSGPVTVSATSTLQAIAAASGFADSAVSSASYTISSSSGGTTLSSADGFYNTPMPSAQSGSFTATIDAVPSISPSNTTIGLCQGAQTAYTGLACVARFNSSGDIDARNGGAYAAASTIPFSAGVSYHFRFVVDVPSHTYSIYVTPAGGSEITVGSNYAFRTEQAGVTSLDTWNVDVAATPGGTVTISNLNVTGSTGGPVAAPTFSPGGGSYSSAQSVTISTTNSGATIRYTTDGSTPTSTTGTIYVSPITVSTTTTLKAIAYATGFADSTVSSATYTISVPQVAAPTFSPAGGSYSSAQSVTIATATGGATIRYTTDGSTPTTTTGTVYAGPVTVSTTTTLKAIAFESGFTNSAVSSASYTISTGTTLSSADGFYNTPMSSAQSGSFTATIDATPSISPSNTTIGLCQGAQSAYTGLACVARFNSSGDIDARNGGAYAAASTIPFSAGVSYHFRFVVSVSSHTYSIYVTPAGGSEITVGSNYAFRTEQAGVTSLDTWNVDVAATPGGTVTISNLNVTTIAQTAAPTFTPAGGTYSSAQTVSISSTTSGASIRYTTDGSTPTSTTGTLYSGPISVSATKTIKAIAYASGMANSAVTSATYTIGSTTNYTPAQILAGVQQRMVSSNQVNTKPHINTMTRAMNVNVYQVNSGVFAYTSSMAIDTDGSDPDPDPDHQSQTTWTDNNGAYLGAHHVPYYVLGDYCYDKVSPCPHFYYAEHNITGLQFALIFYNGKCIGAVFGDTQGDSVTPTSDNDSRELGEASVESANLLGIPSSGTTGGVTGGVTVVIFSGSQWVVKGTNTTLQANAQALVQKALNTLGSAWGM